MLVTISDSLNNCTVESGVNINRDSININEEFISNEEVDEACKMTGHSIELYLRESMKKIFNLQKISAALYGSMGESIFHKINDDISDEELNNRFLGIKFGLDIFAKEIDSIL